MTRANSVGAVAPGFSPVAPAAGSTIESVLILPDDVMPSSRIATTWRSAVSSRATRGPEIDVSGMAAKHCASRHRRC
jgi:hypothetical protein